MVEGTVEEVSRKEVRKAIRKMKQRKAAGLSEATTEMIVAALPTSCGWKGNPG